MTFFPHQTIYPIYCYLYLQTYNFYHPPTNFWEDNVLTGVCFFTGGRVSLVPGPFLVSGPMSFRGLGYLWSHVPSGRRGEGISCLMSLLGIYLPLNTLPLDTLPLPVYLTVEYWICFEWNKHRCMYVHWRIYSSRDLDTLLHKLELECEVIYTGKYTGIYTLELSEKCS